MSWIPFPLFSIPLARDGGSAPNRLWRQRPGANENSLTFTLMSNPGIADGSLCSTKWYGSRQPMSVLNTDKHLRPRSPIESVRCPLCCGEQIVGQGAGEHELGGVVSNFPRSPRLFWTTQRSARKRRLRRDSDPAARNTVRAILYHSSEIYGGRGCLRLVW